MRRLAMAVVVAAMMVLSSCGRQVTGLNSPNSGLVQPGQMQIQFETAAPIDVQNFSYLIVFNTTGNNQQPFAQGLNSNYNSWTYFFVLGGGSSSTFGGTQYTNEPGLFQIFQNPATGSPQRYSIPLVPNQIVYVPQIPGGSTNGFEITFNRCLLDQQPPVATPAPNPSPTPSPTPSGGGVTCPPGVYGEGNVWNISLFTLDSTSSVVDSLSSTGPNDTDYSFAVNAATLNGSKPYQKPVGASAPQNLAAEILGIQVFNNP